MNQVTGIVKALILEKHELKYICSLGAIHDNNQEGTRDAKSCGPYSHIMKAINSNNSSFSSFLSFSNCSITGFKNTLLTPGYK